MAADEPTASDIATCGEMFPDTRRDWVERRKLLGGGPFTEHDAIETAVAATLSGETTTKRAPAAFTALRGELRKRVVAGELDLWAVVPRKGQGFALVKSAREAAWKASGITEPVWLVPLQAAIEQARDRYAELMATLDRREKGAVRTLRSASGKKR